MVILSFARMQRIQSTFTSKDIRTTFINYFEKNEHKFVRSSPVVPLSDPGLAFVNAGMNQFKSIFLGTTKPTYPSVTNYQKCIRVGGKHNDLNAVGQDGYHHTFFEMLGNWSFGEYFKEKACHLAIDLLCGPFQIDRSRLYVTYFSGNHEYNLPADLECLEIWQEMGFPPDHILPFGMKENFWEMGVTGPCGPCAEIHIDLAPYGNTNNGRANLVNTGHPDMIELWNLVFMEYNRNVDETITKLPTQFVDTGMGLERLTAILQNKNSNYDTDIFMPILKAIERITSSPAYTGSWYSELDLNYRILADHARMVCICIADGMLPDKNQKLRRILRRALNISEEIFRNEKTLINLVPVVVERLGSAYPELTKNELAIKELINHEHEIYNMIRKETMKSFKKLRNDYPHVQNFQMDFDCPGFVSAYYELQKLKDKFINRMIPPDFLFKLNDTYGLNEEHFEKIAKMEHLSIDMDAYHNYVNEIRSKTKGSYHASSRNKNLHEITKDLPPTKNHFKYNYSYNDYTQQYDVIPLMARTLGILSNDMIVKELVVKVDDTLETSNDTIAIISDISNFYYEAGGQQSDIGSIIIYDRHQQPVELKVVNVSCVNDCVIHICQLPFVKTDFILKIGHEILLKVNTVHRTANTCHHTAVHLLNAAIRNLYHNIVYQVSSAVNKDHCKLEVGIIGIKLNQSHVEEIENMVNNAIHSAIQIQVRNNCDMNDVLQLENVITVPGEIYPDTGLRIISMNSISSKFSSKELCCGTHAFKTDELKRFCITNLKQTNRARYAFTAAAGDCAEKILGVKDLIQHRIDMLETEINSGQELKAIIDELHKIRHNVIHMNIVLPFTFKGKVVDRINTMLRSIKEITLIQNRHKVEEEIRNVLNNVSTGDSNQQPPFILHYINDSTLIGDIPLQAATNICNNLPILVLGASDTVLSARCCVPENYQKVDFTATKWLKEVADVFKCQTIVPKGCSSNDTCDLKNKKIVQDSSFEKQVRIALDRADAYAKKYLL